MEPERVSRIARGRANKRRPPLGVPSMTVRLYYDDPGLLRFEARLSEVRDAGGRRAVVLDRTAFYPTSGGQPHDTGVLGGARVIEVLEADDGEVLHVVEGDPGSGVLEGRIDPPRRADHRQHHTGQHILSRAFEEVLRAPTIGFHLGPEDVDIDLDAPGVDEKVLRAAEDLANEVVRGDRAIRIHYAETPEERTRFALRKESEREGEIRIIEIDGFDATACGGTHCLTTGEVGLVKIRKWEKVGSRLRIHFLCGGRAIADYGRKNRLVVDLARQFTVDEEGVADAVARAVDETARLRKETRALRQKLLTHEAAELHAGAQRIGGMRLVTRILGEGASEDLAPLAAALRTHAKSAAVLAVREGERGRLALARSDDLPVDLRPIFTSAIAIMEGRGGGRPESVQGAGRAERLDEAVACALDLVRDALSQL
jgi:alanyl-tRNA synthetase